jgi:hypothetical protein
MSRPDAVLDGHGPGAEALLSSNGTLTAIARTRGWAG